MPKASNIPILVGGPSPHGSCFGSRATRTESCGHGTQLNDQMESCPWLKGIFVVACFVTSDRRRSWERRQISEDKTPAEQQEGTPKEVDELLFRRDPHEQQRMPANRQRASSRQQGQ